MAHMSAKHSKLIFHFNRRSHGRLRQLIDTINEAAEHTFAANPHMRRPKVSLTSRKETLQSGGPETPPNN